MACDKHNMSFIGTEISQLFEICNNNEKRRGICQLIPFSDFWVINKNPFSKTTDVLIPLRLMRYKNDLYHNFHTVTKSYNKTTLATFFKNDNGLDANMSEKDRIVGIFNNQLIIIEANLKFMQI